MKAVTTAEHKKLKKIVAYLPGENSDGWWKSEGESFFKCGMVLLSTGMSMNEVEDMLQNMYTQVKSEYGD